MQLGDQTLADLYAEYEVHKNLNTFISGVINYVDNINTPELAKLELENENSSGDLKSI